MSISRRTRCSLRLRPLFSAVPALPGRRACRQTGWIRCCNDARMKAKSPALAALVLRDGQPIYEKAFGWADKEAITSAAVMLLVEVKQPDGTGADGAGKAAHHHP